MGCYHDDSNSYNIICMMSQTSQSLNKYTEKSRMRTCVILGLVYIFSLDPNHANCISSTFTKNLSKNHI